MTERTGSIDDPAQLGYVNAAEAWAGGAMLAYLPLARHLVDRCPQPLRNALVLDAGAGTGAVSTILLEQGAIAVATDLQHGMLARLPVNQAMPIVADLNATPFRSGVFDIAVGAFVLNHLADPLAGLTELRRVVRSGGVILASSFSIHRSAAKNVVDVIATAFGWEPPPWYRHLQGRAALVGTTSQLTAAAKHAGLIDVHVSNTEVDVGLEDPALVARYRLGMPQLAPFVRTLSPRRRHDLTEAATAAVAANGERFRPAVLELVARVSAVAPPRAGEVPQRALRHAGSIARPTGGQ